jgi:hypothetical protein
VVLGSFGTELLSSCADTVTQPRTGEAVGFIHASRVKAYDSIRSLGADAKAVIIAVATNEAAAAELNRIPFTITYVQVRNAFKGRVLSNRIKIRQLGNSKTRTSDEMDPLLASGTTYLLFLNVFTFGPGQDTDQYVVVGGSAGIYIVSGRTATHVRGPDPVPQTISLEELQAELSH